LSSQSYVGFSTASFLNSGVTTPFCWLRSGSSYGSSYALRVGSSGESGGDLVNDTGGVRPAAHLSLSSIASLIPITITYNSNGGSSCASISVAYGSTYGTLPTPTKTGYTFDGWYKSSALTGSAVTSSTTVTTNHTLYAKWTANTYYIEYNGNNATSGNMSVSTHTYDIAKALTTNTYTRTGYSFLGWSTSSTATTATYTNGQNVTNLTSINGGLIVLYAVWQANPYTITIQASSGGSVSSTGGKYASGDTITSFAAPNVGKAFLYWVRASDNAQILENPLNQSVTKNETYTAIFGASVEGVNISSTKGGVVYLVGDDFDNLTDTDTITFATKQVLQGYTFSHWEDMNGNNLGTEMSIRLQKSLVMDNIIKAVYVQSTNNSVNDQVNN
ncbi:MAG: InlB B-repeat-containing protein, partial [Clostridia bacterium]|nr:InlB B-repeat-containing protein [Clostridia bacterium]